MTFPGRRTPTCLAQPLAIKVRPADTELWIEVEKTSPPTVKRSNSGGGKVIRDGMGRGQMRADACDLVITNALIVDHWGS